MFQHCRHPLQDTSCVATSSIAYGDAIRLAPRLVDMVETYCGGGDKAHLSAFEQCLVASSAGANKQGIAISDALCGNIIVTHIDDLGVWLYDTADIGYIAVNGYFHC